MLKSKMIKKFVVHTVGGESVTIHAEQYRVNADTGCIDFFDEQGQVIQDPVVFIHGVAYIKNEDKSEFGQGTLPRY